MSRSREPSEDWVPSGASEHGETVYRKRNRAPVAFGVLVTLIGLGDGGLGLGLGLNQQGRGLSAYKDYVIAAVFTALGVWALRKTIGFYRSPARVVVSPSGLTAYQYVGPTRRAEAKKIATIDLTEMRYPGRNARHQSRIVMRVPLVTMTDKTTFWLDGMMARRNSGPGVEHMQKEKLREIRAILRLHPH